MYEKIFGIQAEFIKALAHSRRLEIINLLRDQELCVSTIHEMLDLPQANVSQHLMILREAGVLTSFKQGKQIYYKLSDPRILEAYDVLRHLLIDRYKNTDIADELTLSMNDLVPVFTDPVCHMRVSPKTAGFTHTHNDSTYYFCASGCHKSFIESPEKYV